MNKLEYIPGDIVKIEYGEATGKIGFVTNTFLRRKGFYSLVVSIGGVIGYLIGKYWKKM